MLQRGVRAIEAFGRSGTEPSDRSTGFAVGYFADHGCLLPADYLRAVGFKTVRAHPRVPRLRLDIRSTATWRADVEFAIEKLFGSIQSPVLSR